MDDRNAVKYADPFVETDALMHSGTPGDSLFVINLCAANLPQSIDADSVRAWGIPGLESYRLYQVSRMEDGRRRYRVRLGFFKTEAAADQVLQSVRGKFATAFTSGLCDEDVKHASTYLKRPLDEIREIQDVQRTGRYRVPKFSAEDLARVNGGAETAATGSQPVLVAQPARPSIARAASAVLDAMSTTHPNSVQAKKNATAAHHEVVEVEFVPTKPTTTARAQSQIRRAQAPAAQAKSVAHAAPKPAPAMTKAVATNGKLPKAPEAPRHLTATTPPPASPRVPQTPNQPFHVGAGRSIPESGLSLTPDKAGRNSASQKSTPGPAQASAQVNVAQNPSQLPRPFVSSEALAKLRAAAAQPRNASAEIPTLDTTQTIRTLTKTEIEDANAPKWYVVQLAISEQPANLDTMPRLDIFEAYRLYSVAFMQNNVIRHALRLGFFSEQVSAEAVMGYVKTFFGDPVIERVSDAEQKRFSGPPPKKPMAEAKTQSRVITLEEKRPKPIELAPPTPPTPSKPERTQQKSLSKAAAPAVKRAATPTKKTGARAQRKVDAAELEEARLLGLSDTAIRRVEHNPSLLSRLVDKLTK